MNSSQKQQLGLNNDVFVTFYWQKLQIKEEFSYYKGRNYTQTKMHACGKHCMSNGNIVLNLPVFMQCSVKQIFWILG